MEIDNGYCWIDVDSLRRVVRKTREDRDKGIGG